MSKATLTRISQKAGVSIATVSRVLSGKDTVAPATRARVLQAVRELEYGAPDTMPERGFRTLLVLLPDFSNPFYADIIEGIQQTARAAGFEVFLLPTGDSYPSVSAVTGLIRREGFAGVLWLCTSPGEKLLAAVEQICPMVMVGEYPDGCTGSYVSIDDVSAAFRAVNYLISTGCRRIGMLNCSMKYKYARHRLEGYRRALDRSGLPFRPEHYTQVPTIDYTLAYSAALQLLHTEPAPDAIFAASDVLAAAVINAAAGLGLRVPEDISVIGFDNVVTSRITQPPITTIAQPCQQLGQQACSILTERVASSDLPHRQILLSTELVIRDSTR